MHGSQQGYTSATTLTAPAVFDAAAGRGQAVQPMRAYCTAASCKALCVLTPVDSAQ